MTHGRSRYIDFTVYDNDILSYPPSQKSAFTAPTNRPKTMNSPKSKPQLTRRNTIIKKLTPKDIIILPVETTRSKLAVLQMEN